MRRITSVLLACLLLLAPFYSALASGMQTSDIPAGHALEQSQPQTYGVPCAAPALCVSDVCACALEGAEQCVCPDACACRSVSPEPGPTLPTESAPSVAADLCAADSCACLSSGVCTEEGCDCAASSTPLENAGTYLPAVYGLFSLPCSAPAYCLDTSCTCDEPDADSCACASDCPCRTLAPTLCRAPGKCANADCLCGTEPSLCICPETCLCRMPEFSFDVTTELALQTIATGAMNTVTVTINLRSVSATFSNLKIKTYIESPLLPQSDFDIESYNLYGARSYTEGSYTVLELSCSSENTVAITYNFDVYFPAGLTSDGVQSMLYTVITGEVREDGQSWSIPPREEEAVKALCTAQAQTRWSVDLTNVDLDYKEPENTADNVFRARVDLSRTPGGSEGVLYLRDDGTLTITFPGRQGENDLNVLRITDVEGNVIPSAQYNQADNVITMNVADIPFPSGFASGYSTAQGVALYIVYELDSAFLAGHVKEVVDGFTLYDGLEMDARFAYGLVDGSADVATDKEAFSAMIYTPGGGGSGSIYKSSDHFTEGNNFFGVTPHTHEAVDFTINYRNSSNTPVKYLVITDLRPALLRLNSSAQDGVEDVSASVPAQAVYFTQAQLVSWNADSHSVSGASARLYAYGSGGTLLPGWPQPIAAGETLPLTQDVHELRLEVDGELKHDFTLTLKVSVRGDSALDQTSRDLINFVRNTASFSATSTKEKTGGGFETLRGSYSSTVHIFPVNTPDPDKIWRLRASVGSTLAELKDAVTLPRGRTVYYRLTVTPDNQSQHVYDPVFYLELPPGIVFDAGTAGAVTFQGSAAGIGLVAEVIANPLGDGSMLRIAAPAGERPLLSPIPANGSITVKATLYEDMPLGSVTTSRAFFGVRSSSTPLNQNAYAPGAYLDDPSLLGESFLLQDSVDVIMQGYGLLEGELWVNTELDRDSGAWHRHPEQAATLPGGVLNYKFVVRNGGSLPAENIVLYNIFSCLDDGYIIGGSGRKSMWQPYLVGPVDVGALPPGTKVYYSEAVDHRVTSGGAYTGAGDWTEQPYNYPGVKSIKVVLPPDYTLPAGQKIEIVLPMYAPVIYDFSQTPPHAAVSSLATQFNFEGKATAALEPLKVTVLLEENNLGEVSGFFWADVDEDGNYDAAEYKEAGVKLTLAGSGLTLTTVTDNDGRYKFTNLPSGTYTISAELPDGYRDVTVGGMNRFGAGDPGFVAVSVTIDTSDGSTTRILEDVDGGIHPGEADISGTVWRSIDGLTARDADISSKDIGLEGVRVTLYRLLGQGQRRETANINTDAGGGYAFAGLPVGRYVVVFTPLANYTIVDRMDKPTTAGAPGKAGYSQALPEKKSNLEVKGQSYEIWLQAATNQAGIDCGLEPAPGSIKGALWRDWNGNGLRDSGDDGLSGYTVTLEKTEGYGAGGASYPMSASTVEDGTYEFKDLTPGTYTLRYTDSAGKEFVSFDGSVVVEGARNTTASYAGLVIKPEDGAAGLDHTGKNFGLVRKASFSGRVFNDKNADGQWTADANHELLQTKNTLVIQRQDNPHISYTHGGGGFHEVEDLWPGSYTVTFAVGYVQQGPDASGTYYDDYMVTTANGGGFTRATRTWTFTLVSGDERENVNLALTRPRSISGVVWHDLNGSGVNESSAEPFLARPLALTGPATGSCASDFSTGAYAFTGLYPGTYTVTVDCATGEDPGFLITNAGNGLNAAGAFSVTVPALDTGAANDPKNKDFGLAKPVSIEGLIWLDKDINSLDDYKSDGAYGIGDTYLQLSGIAQLYRYNAVTTQYAAQGSAQSSSAGGAYRFSNLLPGRYKVELLLSSDTYFITGPSNTLVSGAGYSFNDAANKGTWEDIVLASGDSIGGLNLSLGKYAVLSGELWHDLNGNGAKESATEDRLTSAETLTLARGAAPGTDSIVTGSYSYKIKPGQYTVALKQGARRVTNTAAGFAVYESDPDPADRTAVWTVTYASADQLTYDDRDFLLSIYSGISGDVWVDADADGVPGNGEAPKTGARLTLTYKSGSYADWFANSYPDANKTVDIGAGSAYQFPELWPGVYTLTLTQAGLDAYMRTNLSGSEKIIQGTTDKEWVVTVDSQTGMTANFGLIKPSSLEGMIWRDQNHDDVKDALEPPAGASVRLVRQVTGVMRSIDVPATLDATGYKLEGLLPGTYSMTVVGVNPAWIRTYVEDTLEVTGAGSSASLSAGADRSSYTVVITDDSGEGAIVSKADAAYVAPGAISGVIFDDANNDGARDSVTEPLLSGVQATLRRMNPSTNQYEAVSPAPDPVVNADGNFSFGGLLPGQYELAFTGVDASYLTTTPDAKSVMDPSGVGAVFARAERVWTVTLSADGQLIDIYTGVVRRATLSGAVWKDANADASGVTVEEGYVGLNVYLYKGTDTSGAASAATQTGSGGAYSFEDLYPGAYTVVLTKPDGSWYVTNTGSDVLTNPAQQSVTVASGQNSTGNNFGLTQLISISGHIWEDRDATGANGVFDTAVDTPLGGVTVTLAGTTGLNAAITPQSVPTQSDGSYSFTGLVPGAYTISCADAIYGSYAMTNSFAGVNDPGGEGVVTLDARTRTWSVTRKSGYHQQNVDFALSQWAVIRGLVWHDENADSSALDEDGLGSIGITVQWSSNDTGPYTPAPGGSLTTSSAAETLGGYLLAVTEAGYYKITVTLPAPAADWGVTNVYALEQTVYVPAMGVTREADFGLSKYIELSGRVWVEGDGDGIYAVGENGQRGHRLSLTRNGTTLSSPFTAGQDGVFNITKTDELFAGDYELVFADMAAPHIVTNTGTGFTPSERKWTLSGLVSGAVRTGLDCAFTPERTVSGTVWHDLNANALFESAAPQREPYLSRLSVALLYKDGSGDFVSYKNAITTTGQDGGFSFGQLPPGVYRAVVQDATGYVRTNPEGTQTSEDLYIEYSFEQTDTPPASSLIGLAKPIRLSGRAFIDKDSDGAYSALADSPAVVEVTLARTAPTADNSFVPFMTDAAGGYDSDAWVLLPGTYTVTFAELSGHTVSNTGVDFSPALLSWTVTLLSGEERNDLDIGYKSTGYVVTGFVWKDVDGSGTYEDAAEGFFVSADGVTITATHTASGQTYTGSVGDDGCFSIPVDLPGDFTLSAVLPGTYIPYLITNRDASYDRPNNVFFASISYESQTDYVAMGAALASSIAGRLWWDINANALDTDIGETPLAADVRVQLIDDQGRVETEMTIGANGGFSFLGLKPGLYSIILPEQAPSFFTGYRGSSALPDSVSAFNAKTGVWQILLSEGQALVNANSGFHTPSTISGVLLEQNGGAPLANREVTLRKKDENGAFQDWMTATTDAQGIYAFAMLLPGDYQVLVSIPDGYNKTTDSEGVQQGNIIVVSVTIVRMDENLETSTKVRRPAAGNDDAQPRDNAPGAVFWLGLGSGMAQMPFADGRLQSGGVRTEAGGLAGTDGIGLGGVPSRAPQTGDEPLWRPVLAMVLAAGLLYFLLALRRRVRMGGRGERRV